jgi:hypothetical protein
MYNTDCAAEDKCGDWQSNFCQERPSCAQAYKKSTPALYGIIWMGTLDTLAPSRPQRNWSAFHLFRVGHPLADMSFKFVQELLLISHLHGPILPARPSHFAPNLVTEIISESHRAGPQNWGDMKPSTLRWSLEALRADTDLTWVLRVLSTWPCFHPTCTVTMQSHVHLSWGSLILKLQQWDQNSLSMYPWFLLSEYHWATVVISESLSENQGKGQRWLLRDNAFSVGSHWSDVTRTACLSLVSKIGACIETARLIWFQTPLS